MPSPFQGIDTVSRALQAFQRALDVTGHNLANVNTKGYTRQVVDYSPTSPTAFQSLGRHSLGTGVGIAAVTRAQDAFLQSKMLSAQGSLGRHQSKANSLGQVEAVFGGVEGNPLLTRLNAFFNSWSALSANPSSSLARLQVQTAGDSLAASVRTSYADLAATKTQVQLEISQTLTRVRELTADIAKLNGDIRQEVVAGASPNDLLDKRDQALQELGGLVSIQTYGQPDGAVTVHAGSMLLIDGSSTLPVPTGYDASTFTLTDSSGSYSFKGGKLYGQFESLNQITSYQGQLDAFAADLRDQVNLLHQSGIAGNGATNVSFFAGSSASTFSLSAEVASDPLNIAAGTSGNAGDGALALSLSQVRDQAQAALGSKTYATFLTDFIAGVGHDVASAQESLKTQSAVASQIEEQIQSVSGVSIDDEMANMLRLQRSYQAVAKALSLFNQVTEDLINMVR